MYMEKINSKTKCEYFILGSTYYFEREARMNYLKTAVYQKSLENFRDLLSRVLPFGLMIIQNGEITFSNIYCKKLLNFTDQRSLNDSLSEITIEPEKNSTKEIPERKEDGTVGSYKLRDKIKEFYNEDGVGFTCVNEEFQNLSGFIISETITPNTQIIPLDIQIGFYIISISQEFYLKKYLFTY